MGLLAGYGVCHGVRRPPAAVGPPTRPTGSYGALSPACRATRPEAGPARCHAGGVKTIFNILWLVLCGLWLAIGYVLVGVVMCLLIITIPFGVASFRLAAFVLWPFGRTLVPRADAGAGSFIANVLWFLLAGLWMAIAHILTGLALCVTVIGIPLGIADFKLAAAAIAPLGKDIVRTDDPAAFYRM